MTGKNGAIVSPRRNCAHFSSGKNSEGVSPSAFFRGQVTAEYLLLVAVGISLLAISLVALTSIKGAEMQVYSREKARIIAYDLSSIGNEICALGDGNSRGYSWEKAEIGCAGNMITVSVSGASANSSISDCEIECGGEYSGEIRIRNSHGKVLIEGG